MANPSIPIAGPSMLPDTAASTSSVPMMGPVQENDTNTNVKAMKNMLIAPDVLSAFHPSCLSILMAAPAQSRQKKAMDKKNQKGKEDQIEQCAGSQIIQRTGAKYSGN